MATKKATQTNIAKPEVKGTWLDRVNEAKELADILPKLDFGKKGDEISHVIVFTEDEPRFISFRDKYASEEEWVNGEPPLINGLAINVRVVESAVHKSGEPRSILMRDDPQHGLTSKILSLAKRHKTLGGVKIRIATRNYNHPRFGPGTRGYDVVDLGREEPADTP